MTGGLSGPHNWLSRSGSGQLISVCVSLIACHHRYAVAEASRSLSHFGAVHGPDRAAGVDEMEGVSDADQLIVVVRSAKCRMAFMHAATPRGYCCSSQCHITGSTPYCFSLGKYASSHRMSMFSQPFAVAGSTILTINCNQPTGNQCACCGGKTPTP